MVDADGDDDEVMGQVYQLNPAVRVRASYKADVSLPEEIEVAWEMAEPDVDGVIKVLEALSEVPRRRWEHLDVRDLTGSGG